MRALVRRAPVLVLLPLAALVGLACDSGTGLSGDQAQVQVLLTDAPDPRIGSAEVSISRVYLLPSTGEADGEPGVDLFNDADNPQVYDLLDLQGGITANLTDAVGVEPGTYQQLRLVVDGAEITLAEGFTFESGESSKALFVPSGMETGIKVQLAEPIAADAGGLTIVTVDFDVGQNFIIQPGASEDTVRDILFTPTLVESAREEESAG